MKRRWLSLFTILCFTMAGVVAAAEQDEDAYYAGTVVETSRDHLKVSGVRQGKTEERTFRMTPQTKIEGRLAARVRVTVRYVSGADGDTATLVIVRTDADKGKKK